MIKTLSDYMIWLEMLQNGLLMYTDPSLMMSLTTLTISEETIIKNSKLEKTVKPKLQRKQFMRLCQMEKK